ncbi:MAG: NADH:ubiquinone reductase (Na(+)-transporting) subunit B [Bacteroidales bacterium]
MKALRNYVDKIKPHFEKGGKLEKLHSVFDGFETFLFVPNKVTSKGSHIRDAIDMKRTMATVVLAMVPALLFGIWNVGYQHFQGAETMPEFWTIVGYGLIKVLPIVVVSYVTGLAIEFFFAQIRGHEINEGFLVSGMLIPLVLPPTIPLWMVALATAFAVILGKEVFGGTGMNILNPALTARAFLFFAYPAYMSGDKVWIAGNAADATTGATPLAEAAAGNTSSIPDFWDMFFGFIPGSIGETSTALIIVGAIILLFTGVGSWRIMLTAVLGGYIMGLLFNLWGANEFMQIPAHQQLVMGGFAFGVVFMATDPVSATQTTKGKYIYGFLIGFLGILIRVFNPAYPEGIMLAILFMNVMAPLIDHYVIQSNIKHRMKRAKLKSA